MKCAAEGCYEEHNLEQCPYCKKFFCPFHIKPVAPADSEYDSPIPQNLSLRDKVDRKKGHYCRQYLESTNWFDSRKQEWNSFGSFIIDEISEEQEKTGSENANNSVKRASKRKPLGRNSKALLLLGMVLTLFALLLCGLFVQSMFAPKSYEEQFRNSEQAFSSTSTEHSWTISQRALKVQSIRHGLYELPQTSGRKMLRFDLEVSYTGADDAVFRLVCDGFVDSEHGLVELTKETGIRLIKLPGGGSRTVSLLYDITDLNKKPEFPLDYVILVESRTRSAENDSGTYSLEIKS